MLLAIQILMTVTLALGILVGLADEKYWFLALIFPPAVIVFTWIWPFVAILIIISGGIIHKIAKLIKLYGGNTHET